MDVSIIIVTYNTCKLTQECIDSIYKYTTNKSFEVIVVDNASKDNTRDVLSKDDRIIYIYSEINLGFGKANNIGIKQSKGRYIFLLNSDTLLLNDAIDIFINKMDCLSKQVACVGCKLLSVNNSYSLSYGNFVNLSTLFPFSFSKGDEPHFDGFYKVEVVIGADMFIRREALEKVGLFDPRFFMYHEENDLQRRFYNAGYICGLISGPQIKHLEGKSNKYKLNSLTIGGLYTYIKKWYWLPVYWFYRVCFAALRTPKVVFSHNKLGEKLRYLNVLWFYKS